MFPKQVKTTVMERVGIFSKSVVNFIYLQNFSFAPGLLQSRNIFQCRIRITAESIIISYM